MEKARYKNPWHNFRDRNSGPDFYETSAKPVEHAGHLIYQRIEGHIWDVVKDGVCVSQRAGLNGAKRAAEQGEDMRPEVRSPSSRAAKSSPSSM